jgi:hypothetical protein
VTHCDLQRQLGGRQRNQPSCLIWKTLPSGSRAIADLGAFELPFSFDSIHGASQLCCPTSRACNVLSREYELDRCVLATLGRRCDLNRGRDTSGNPDDYQLRWLTSKDCKSLFDLPQIKASDSSVKLHQLVQILRIQHSAAQSSMSHVITVGETDRGISTEAYHAAIRRARKLSEDKLPSAAMRDNREK